MEIDYFHKYFNLTGALYDQQSEITLATGNNETKCPDMIDSCQYIQIETIKYNKISQHMQKQADTPSSSCSFVFKYIVIGDTGVGKSCLLLQFIDKRFRLKHEPTIGVEFGAKTISVRGKSIKLQVWDTAGQESFRSITRGYYRSAAGAIMVYDVSNRDSFTSLNSWLTEAKTSGNEDMSYILVANKCDLDMQRKVSYEQGDKFAKDNDMIFLEASAKTGYNVESAFLRVTENLLTRIEKGEIDVNNPPAGVKVGNGQATFESENKKNGEEARNKCC